jgi:hypothetical protein
MHHRRKLDKVELRPITPNQPIGEGGRPKDLAVDASGVGGGSRFRTRGRKW